MSSDIPTLTGSACSGDTWNFLERVVGVIRLLRVSKHGRTVHWTTRGCHYDAGGTGRKRRAEQVARRRLRHEWWWPKTWSHYCNRSLSDMRRFYGKYFLIFCGLSLVLSAHKGS